MRRFGVFIAVWVLALAFGGFAIAQFSGDPDAGVVTLAVLGLVFLALGLMGLFDLFQTRNTLWRNFPVMGHMRGLFLAFRPFFRSYLVESETEGRPFDHETRQLIYDRSANKKGVEPFGSHVDAERVGYEWLAPSIGARDPAGDPFRVEVGRDRAKPYSASILNISAMSFGSLGGAAIEALNRGAAKGGFFHDTGEGGISRYHEAGGGDLVWELGSGYFGCRAKDGGFDPEQFRDEAASDQVKMIEIKLSQGAKPGHGGILPGEKVTEEIAEARGIPIGETCVSPPYHRAFSTPLEMMDFITRLRELSGDKPVGIKMCVGQPHEVFALVKAMLQTGVRPDFVVVDGAEGGTGGAPAEFLDHIGAPLRNGLILWRNALVGAGLKDEVRLAASGKQVTAFQMAASLALGADWINTARGFMFSLGCVQSLKCQTNRCPTGIATMDEGRQRGLVVPDKAERVYNFHKTTTHALSEVVAAAGCQHPSELRPHHLRHRVDMSTAASASTVYKFLEPGALLGDAGATRYARDWARASADTFDARFWEH